MATGAYKRLLGLLQAQRKDAVSQAGFSLGKNVIEEREEIGLISNEVHTLSTLCSDKTVDKIVKNYLPTRVLRTAFSISSIWGRASFSRGME